MRKVGVLLLKQGDNQGSIDGDFRRRPSSHGHAPSDIIAAIAVTGCSMRRNSSPARRPRARSSSSPMSSASRTRSGRIRRSSACLGVAGMASPTASGSLLYTGGIESYCGRLVGAAFEHLMLVAVPLAAQSSSNRYLGNDGCAPRLLRLDEAATGPDLVEFRRSLQNAVTHRDVDAV